MDIATWLPIDGPAGKMLTAAAQAGPDAAWPSVADMSRAAGLNRMTGNRAHTRLVEADVLARDQSGWWVLNVDHPYMPLLREIVAQVTGDPAAIDAPIESQPLIWRDEFDKPTPNELASAAHLEGPTAAEVMTTLQAMGDLSRGIGSLERSLQAVYSFAKNERARDMVHALMSTSVWAHIARAERLLDQELRRTVDERPAHQRPTHLLPWAVAIAALVDEAEANEHLCAWLVESIQVGWRLTRLQQQLLEDLKAHLHEYGRPKADNPHREDFERRWAAKDAQLRSDMLRRLHERNDLYMESRGDIHHVGGMPGPDDIGALGDELLAVQLRRISVAVLELAHQMADHPSYRAWLDQHPTDAPTIPPVPARDLETLRVHGYAF